MFNSSVIQYYFVKQILNISIAWQAENKLVNKLVQNVSVTIFMNLSTSSTEEKICTNLYQSLKIKNNPLNYFNTNYSELVCFVQMYVQSKMENSKFKQGLSSDVNFFKLDNYILRNLWVWLILKLYWKRAYTQMYLQL